MNINLFVCQHSEVKLPAPRKRNFAKKLKPDKLEAGDAEVWMMFLFWSYYIFQHLTLKVGLNQYFWSVSVFF